MQLNEGPLTHYARDVAFHEGGNKQNKKREKAREKQQNDMMCCNHVIHDDMNSRIIPKSEVHYTTEKQKTFVCLFICLISR